MTMFDAAGLSGHDRSSSSTEINAGRYEISATVANETSVAYADDLILAQTILHEGLERPFVDDRVAHGGIYDRRTFKTVRSWRGGPVTAPTVNPIIALFESAIASGAKVTLITPAGSAEFEGAAR